MSTDGLREDTRLPPASMLQPHTADNIAFNRVCIYVPNRSSRI